MMSTHYDQEYSTLEVDTQTSWEEEYDRMMAEEEEFERTYQQVKAQSAYEKDAWMYQPSKAEETQALQDWLKADEARFQAEMEELKKLEAKMEEERVKKLPTEDEMQKVYEEEFLPLVRADKEKRAEEEILVLDWIEAHPDTEIDPKSDHDAQYLQYLRECTGEFKKKRALKAEQASIEAKKMVEKRYQEGIKAQAKKRKDIWLAKQGPNVKGKLQGVKKKKVKTLGKRAQKREDDKKTEIVIIPRETLVKEDLIVESDNEEEEEVVVEKVVFDERSHFLPKEEPKVVVAPKEEAPKEEEVEDEDDFLEAMIKAEEKRAPTKKVVKKAKKSAKKVEDDGFQVVSKKKRGGRKKKQVLDIKVGQTYTEEKRTTNKRYDSRCQGFEAMSNKKEMEKKLTRTRMCKSVGSGEKCKHGAKCRFAHSIEELTIRECAWKDGCRFVRKVKGEWVNKGGKAAKVCSCKHPGETEENFCARLNITCKSKAPTKHTPVELTLKKKVVTKRAPWAKAVPKSEPTIIRVTKDKVQSTMAAMIAAGITDFKVELIE